MFSVLWVDESSNMINVILNFIKIQVFVKKILKNRKLPRLWQKRLKEGNVPGKVNRLRPAPG